MRKHDENIMIASDTVMNREVLVLPKGENIPETAAISNITPKKRLMNSLIFFHDPDS
jgi:hypothetical protein